MGETLADIYWRLSANDAVDGSSTGIAIYDIAIAVEDPPMSPVGTSATFVGSAAMSGLPPNAEVGMGLGGVNQFMT